MKLIFKKAEDEKATITVNQLLNGEEKEFSYVDMIKALMDETRLEEPQVGDNFSDEEKKSIRDMVGYINEAVSDVKKTNDE